MQRAQQSEDDEVHIGSVSSSLSQLDQVSGGKCCSCCLYYNTMGESEEHSNLGDDLTNELPEECLETAEKMYIGLLDHYFVKRHPKKPSIGPLSPADCIGDKYYKCPAFKMMKEEVKKKFPIKDDNVIEIADDFFMETATTWFDKKQREFENFDKIEIVDIQEPDSSLGNKTELKIFVPAGTRKDKMLRKILDDVYNRFSVGFIMSWGIHGQKSTRLYQVIQKKISDRFREANQETTDPDQFDYEAEKEAEKKEIETFSKSVGDWYHSKLPLDNPPSA